MSTENSQAKQGGAAEPETSFTQSDAARRRSRATLLLLVVLFALPNIAALYFYLNRDSIDLSHLATNHGTIVSPVRQPGDMPLQTLTGDDFKLSDMQGKWIMVTIGSSSCAKDCQDNLYTIRQVRKATGEFYKRIERLFFLTDSEQLDSFRQLMQDYKGMQVVVPGEDREAYQRYLQVFSLEGADIVDGIYFIDPLGNYMMAYPKQTEPKKVLKDLMRLLKISQIG